MDNNDEGRQAQAQATGKGRAPAEEKASFSQGLADFIRAHRVGFIAFVGLVLALIIGLAVWSALSSANAKAAATRTEALAQELSSWISATEESKKAELEKSLSAGIDEVLAKWPRSFGAQRALGLKARIAEEKKDWKTAEETWLAVADRFPKVYLAPIALKNASVAAEERGAPEQAAAYLGRLVKDYEKSAPGMAHAYFALGRLAEQAKDYATAGAHYEKIVASFPDDDWTKLAKDRIIFLKSRGLLK